MTTATGVVGLSPGADQGVVVTAGAAGTVNGDDAGMIRCSSVRSLPGAGMTLAAIACRCDRSIRCRVVTGNAAVMLFDVRSVDEVDVVDGFGVTAATFGLQSHQTGVVLGGMGAEVSGDTTVTLIAVTSCRTGQLGGRAVTEIGRAHV